MIPQAELTEHGDGLDWLRVAKQPAPWALGEGLVNYLLDWHAVYEIDDPDDRPEFEIGIWRQFGERALLIAQPGTALTGMNEELPAVVRWPRAVLDSLGSVDDGPGPRLSNG